MKNKIQALGSLAVFSVILFLASCTTNEADSPTPIDSRDKYIGTWSCAENSSKTGASTFDVRIRKNVNNNNQFLIDNFYLLGNQYSASVNVSGTSLSIAQQSISGNTVQGSGTIQSDTKISLTYSVNDGSGGAGAIDNCTAVLTKL